MYLSKGVYSISCTKVKRNQSPATTPIISSFHRWSIPARRRPQQEGPDSERLPQLLSVVSSRRRPMKHPDLCKQSLTIPCDFSRWTTSSDLRTSASSRHQPNYDITIADHRLSVYSIQDQRPEPKNSRPLTTVLSSPSTQQTTSTMKSHPRYPSTDLQPPIISNNSNPQRPAVMSSFVAVNLSLNTTYRQSQNLAPPTIIINHYLNRFSAPPIKNPPITLASLEVAITSWRSHLPHRQKPLDRNRHQYKISNLQTVQRTRS